MVAQSMGRHFFLVGPWQAALDALEEAVEPAAGDGTAGPLRGATGAEDRVAPLAGSAGGGERVKLGGKKSQARAGG